MELQPNNNNNNIAEAEKEGLTLVGFVEQKSDKMFLYIRCAKNALMDRILGRFAKFMYQSIHDFEFFHDGKDLLTPASKPLEMYLSPDQKKLLIYFTHEAKWQKVSNTSDTSKSRINNRRKILNIYYENMNGLNKQNKMSDLLISASIADYDVIAITETWLDSTIRDCEFLRDNYTVYRKDREKSVINATKGGGVLIAIKKEIVSELVETPEMMPLESICVKIPTNNGNIYIYNLYIQPASSTSNEIFSESINNHIEAIKRLKSIMGSSDSLLIFGDYNLKHVEWCANDLGLDFIPIIGDSQSKPAVTARSATTELLNTGLFQLCNIKNDWNNVLDLVYTDVPELVVINEADFPLLPSEKRDRAHRPLQCNIECTPNAFPRNN